MIHSIVHFMVSNQVFTLFICLAIGFLIGNYKIAGKFNIGATVGTLIVTLIVGQIGSFPRDEMLGTIFFGAFMFSVGYRIGPQLLVSLKLFGSRILIASIFWMVVAFLVGWSLFSAFKIGPGIAAGVISGALTQSATVASSLQTIGSLPVSQSVRATYEAQLPVAYALKYVAAFHDGKMTDHLEYQLRAGDLLTVIGYAVHFDRLMRVPGLTEVLTPTNAPRERAFVLGKNFKPSELALLRQHGVFVNIQDPISGNQQLINQLRPGDVISLTGNTSRTKAILKKMGRWKAADTAMNYSLFSLGIGCASLLGIIGLKLNSIPLQLGNGTAALIMGLILSSWIERHRDRKSIPVTVTSFLQSFGLTLFVGTVGLQSAQAFTSAIKSLGIGVLFIGAMISIMPHLLTLFFGRYVLKMEPLALIGAMTGSGTIAAAMNEISQKAGPEGGAYYAAAFTPAFVVGNIGITLLGPIFVALLS